MLKNVVTVKESDFVKTIKDASNVREYKDEMKANYGKKHRKSQRQRNQKNNWFVSNLANLERG